MNNHPFATHLRTVVKDALVVLIDKGVPNAIPEIGFRVVMKIDRDLRKKLGKRVTKFWIQMQFGPEEVWMVPAWHLLQMADDIDKPLEAKTTASEVAA